MPSVVECLHHCSLHLDQALLPPVEALGSHHLQSADRYDSNNLVCCVLTYAPKSQLRLKTRLNGKIHNTHVHVHMYVHTCIIILVLVHAQCGRHNTCRKAMSTHTSNYTSEYALHCTCKFESTGNMKNSVTLAVLLMWVTSFISD